MDVFTAKALNSTLGTEKFQAFDQLIGTQFEKINEAIQNNLAKEIESRNQVKGLVASDFDRFEDVYRYCKVNKNGKQYTEIMPCDGSAYITNLHPYQTGASRYIQVYLNGVSVDKYPWNDFTVKFKKGDEITIAESSQNGNFSTDMDVFIFAKEVNLQGIKFY